MIVALQNLSRTHKRVVSITFDVFTLIFCCWLSFALRYGEWHANEFAHWPAYLIAPVVSIPVFIRLGLYRAVIRYIGQKAVWTVAKAVAFSVLLWATAVHLLGLPHPIPRSVIFIYWFIAVVAIGGSRMMARWVLLAQFPVRGAKQDRSQQHVVIYGAGSSGRQLGMALRQSRDLMPVAFVDDDPSLIGLDINDIRVHNVDELGGLIEKLDVTTVLLAVPSASRIRRKEIVSTLERYPVKVLTLPGLSDLASGKFSISDLREIEISDLLGREEVQPDLHLLQADIKAKNVLVTGAGGSIGSELCRQIIAQRPNKLVLFEQSEHALFLIEQELRKESLKQQIELIPVLGSVTDQIQLEQVLQGYQIQTLYHAAAYKHVPMVEHNMVAGIRNNVFGTYKTVQAAISSGVASFVLISTDKAVRPTNVMGTSKRFAELILQAMASDSVDTRFTIVRFGNVLGSSGSVIPTFKQQIEQGGPVTVTHPDITRYFMTIPEAASLVIQAGSMGSSGDVFVLDMGQPVKIRELAEQMIRLAGFSVRDEANPNGDIEIIYSGLRDGEKLYEELLVGDNVSGTTHPMIMKADEVRLSVNELQLALDQLAEGCQNFDHQRIRQILLSPISGYQPHGEITDPLYKNSSFYKH